jgi:hypothetical protein
MTAALLLPVVPLLETFRGSVDDEEDDDDDEDDEEDDAVRAAAVSLLPGWGLRSRKS